MDYYELWPIHICNDRSQYYANGKWFTTSCSAPNAEQDYCVLCGKKFFDPADINHIEHHMKETSYGISYPVIRGGKIDKRTLRKRGHEIRYGNT